MTKLLDIDAGGRQRIDRYELIGEIASGGMATVYLARLTGVGGFQRFVAIKRLLPSVMHNDEFVSMFIDEAKIATQLNHANITQIYELGQQDGQFFIVMEFVHGKELRALNVRAKKIGKKLDPRFAAYVVAKSAEGLDYAHHKKDASGRPMNIVHRDISPQNILLSYDGDQSAETERHASTPSSVFSTTTLRVRVRNAPLSSTSTSMSLRKTTKSDPVGAVFATASSSAGVAVNAGLSSPGCAYAMFDHPTTTRTPRPRMKEVYRVCASSAQLDPIRVMNLLVPEVGGQGRGRLVDDRRAW